LVIASGSRLLVEWVEFGLVEHRDQRRPAAVTLAQLGEPRMERRLLPRGGCRGAGPARAAASALIAAAITPRSR